MWEKQLQGSWAHTRISYTVAENSVHKTTRHTDQDPCRVQLDFFKKEQAL